MNDCIHEALLLECNTALTGVEIRDNSIHGAKHAVYEYLGGTGEGTIRGLSAEGITGEFHVDQAPGFDLTWEEEITETTEARSEPEDAGTGFLVWLRQLLCRWFR